MTTKDNIYSIDWAVKKNIIIFDGEKTKSIPPTIDAIEKFLASFDGGKATFLFEAGGADVFKLLAFRAGHAVMQIPGRRVKESRDSQVTEKSDENDARLLWQLWQENNGGGAMNLLPLLANEIVPAPFYAFTEDDKNIAELQILFREHEKLKQEIVREKNRLIAFKRRFEVAAVEDVGKIAESAKTAIKAKEKALALIKAKLGKKLKAHKIWNGYLSKIKGIGPVIGAGLIGEIGSRQFASPESLRHYAGMIPKSESTEFNRFLKVILYHVIEGFIKHRTPGWREKYDELKSYYASKHPDWRKGKIDSYAKKLLARIFLDNYGKKRGG